ncbi:hypothetical protein [Pseudoduganella lutea]|uniref:Succinate dehydrogenase n=1 Tax=Pseudoduganella lutea TaxID=321985 RepID=A0A4P6L592_9BURK|nr:hypothetical protein [Pseudoduganella lutea]QBE66515.1 hypothetical protein EWM63_29035 [Pseudoduganella lutea]
MPDRAALQVLHRCSGLVLAAFVCVHLVNHALLAVDADSAFAFMDVFRRLYRQPLVETLLLAAVLAQIATGPMLARCRPARAGRAGMLAAASGYYLLFFLLVHVTAVLWGRLGLGLDTDIGFAAAGLRAWPAIAFFVPYYFLAVAAVCVHAGLGIGRLFAVPPRTVAMVSGAAGALAGTAIVGGMLALP